MSRHIFKPGDKLRVKVNQGDSRTSAGNGIEDGDVVTYTQDSRSGSDIIVFTRADGTEGTEWASRFEYDTQLAKVRAFVRGTAGLTLSAIAEVTGASEAAVSARLRDLRKEGFEVTCRKVKGHKQRVYDVSFNQKEPAEV